MLPDKLLKPYQPTETEGRIYKLWEESGFFNPDKLPNAEQRKPFCIIMPPPNVTGVLHMGHALMLTLQDIMIRYKRMRGFRTLWLPGTDHAAIATQVVVEKEIYKKEGRTRHEIGREEFLRRVSAFVEQNRATITSQIRIMGASCDWSREAFTLDEKRNATVRAMFQKMRSDGLIYRGNRIINWDPKGQTTISDDEIVYVEEKTTFYYFKYGPFVIGTSRPETKFGDKYVVMHPNDKRYAKYEHGDKLTLEWINGPVTATVIKDEAVDMEFGSGVMTITPWHDAADFEIAERHGLDKEQIIDEHGKLLPTAGEFAGQKIAEARQKIVLKLRAKGLLVKEESYTHNLATAERTGGTIEPQIKLQWFVDVDRPISTRGGKTLKELMREPVEKGEIQIIPDYFAKTYFHWIDNLRDWCISRQIWYGHKIPIEGEEDTLDTWFSSGLWTFSTLGWPSFAETATNGKPGPENDLANYHPTDVLETGTDILFFWVARMILMSEYALSTVPFRTVYLNGLVRDAQGRKFSKTLGNGIDPIEIAQKFGADAGRMALIVGNTPGTDLALSEEKIKGYKHFANKLWNIARFVLSRERTGAVDADIKKECEVLVKDITSDMEAYRFHLAAEKIYHFVWHRFADVIIEESKKRDGYGATLYYLLENSLKLLHPFMPFVTEEIWGLMPERKNLLMIEKWPQ